jgi:purine-binding chemotaxis protein CheW
VEDSKIIVFKLGEQLYGADILPIQEILLPKEPVKVPNNPSFIEGVIDHRGQVIPVLDLKKRFGLGKTQLQKEARLIVARIGTKNIAFAVDTVLEITNAEKQQRQEAPDMVKIKKEYIAGMVRLNAGIIVLLDLSKVLTVEEQDLI